MALIEEIHCAECTQVKPATCRGGVASPICVDCAATQASTKREAHLAELENLPLEERIRRIEKWVYDYHSGVSVEHGVLGASWRK